ncbi:MAG TPA: ATP-dependent RecD-like DNA helicase [Candidatus Eisenbergiella stercorigallinarum]|uniref:ATP-dependent RecD2 DNA helicase n=1 Tax=Candidatus Eisenbergiella stercorigallinarum TaxID=2838557 RepID=A0A9D2R4S2_9FIRM|nr:ATP-dependent RecD-like DNA helicase [Candidatus Eisenbergiella stercorigallinarum]
MEKVSGYVEHIIYRNTENGYTVFELIADGEEITCVGSFQAIDEGEGLELSGGYVEHAVYGSQFKVESYEETLPEDEQSMERYLGSGAVRGVGPSLAARIVKKFGKDTFRIVEQEPERLAEVKGISERKAMEISAQMEEKKDLRAAMIYLQKYGISNALAMRIYQTYKEQVYHILEENPYRLAEDIDGIGFRRADELAARIGIHTDSDFRVRSGILYALQLAAADGNTCLPKAALLEKAAQLLGLPGEYVSLQLPNLAMERKLVIRQTDGEDLVYAASLYYAELSCARLLADLNMSFVPPEGLLPSEEEKLLCDIEKLARRSGIELEALQQQAVLECVKNGVMILTGGPGTGKTTTINTVIRYFEAEGMDLLLAAPTGRAAKRMTEATGYEARTIHRLLELSGIPEENGSGGLSMNRARFERNADNPLEADVVIVDEMSMVDIQLFQSLLKAVSPGTRLVLVGDVNQLPSVGPGQVLRDLIESRAFPVVELKKIFRQAGESDIVVNAHRINEGKEIALDNKSRDFFFLQRDNVQVIYKHMILLIREKLPGYVHAGPFDIQVLTPMRKGNLGAETLNGILQAYLNPKTDSKKEYQSPDTLFREGDKVMQTKNNYQLEWEVVSRYGIPVDHGVGIFNGDMGVVRQIDPFARTMTVEFDEQRRVTYSFEQTAELELAYAITIHKSQGSEYPAVIMPLLGGPKMLFNRNLLYTGVTRARDCVTILGSSQVVLDMIRNESEAKRFTGLDARIREIMAVKEPDERT